MSSMTQRKISTIAIWGMVFLLAAANTLLIKQNLGMRAHLKVLQERLDPASANMHPGDEAQSFSSTDLNGQPYQVDYKGEGRKKIFLFFTPTCPYCAQQVPYWRELLNNIDSTKYEVVGITGEREDKQSISSYLKEVGYSNTRNPLPVVFVSDNVLRSYKLTSTPTTLMIASNGRVENVWVGRWDADTAAKASAALGLPAHQ
jgi:peroxiredoxin